MEIGQSILMAKKMADGYEMETWFQIAYENSCALEKLLTFN